jgi:hypothetical protein
VWRSFYATEGIAVKKKSHPLNSLAINDLNKPKNSVCPKSNFKQNKKQNQPYSFCIHSNEYKRTQPNANTITIKETNVIQFDLLIRISFQFDLVSALIHISIIITSYIR